VRGAWFNGNPAGWLIITEHPVGLRTTEEAGLVNRLQAYPTLSTIVPHHVQELCFKNWSHQNFRAIFSAVAIARLFFWFFPNGQSSLALDASRYAICTLVMMGPTTAGEKHPGKLNWRQDGY
jgi:hypothetical protein